MWFLCRGRGASIWLWLIWGEKGTSMSWSPVLSRCLSWAGILQRGCHLKTHTFILAPRGSPWIKDCCQGEIKRRGASLVVKWLGSSANAGAQVRSLVWEDCTCYGATKSVHHNYWTCALEPGSCNSWAHVLQLSKPRHLQPELCKEKLPQWEAHTLQWRVAPTYCN